MSYPWFTAAEWLQVTKHEKPAEVIPAMARALCALPPPYPAVTEEAALRDFTALARRPADELLTPAAAAAYRHQTVSPGRCLGLLTTATQGLLAAERFTAPARWRGKHQFCPSPWARWRDPWYMEGLLRELWARPTKGVTPVSLRSLLLVRGHTSAQFRPAAAKALYDYFSARRVLDVCAGWGGRLVGFAASRHGEEYLGVDTNPEMHGRYEQMAALCCPRRRTEFVMAPAQQCRLAERRAGYFDLAFTSPPYAYCEQYPGTVTPVAPVEAWEDSFLAPVLHETWACLAPGGVLLLNLPNVKVRQVVLDLASAAHRVMGGVRADFIGSFALGLHARKGAVAGAEPVWAWRKAHA